MTAWDACTIVLQGAIVFAASTTLFDVVHYLLHRWQRSRFAALRTLARWHHVHHEFLDGRMQVHPEVARDNLIYHLIPEYLTALVGTLLSVLLFNKWAVIGVAALHTVMFAARVYHEGVDANHMTLPRLSGRRPLWFVTSSYHALHHIFPHQYYSSFINVFDLIFGTGCQIRGRTFLVTGASGALGSAFVRRLENLGGVVITAKSGVDYQAGDYARLNDKLRAADVLVLAHGAKSVDCWNANVTTFVDLIDRFVALGKDRLVPPEVWAVGSEIELHGPLGQAAMRDYSLTKRAFAAQARQYYNSCELTYRHIVPASFTSSMGPGLMSANQVAAVAVFLIRRGFRYIPVTYTTLAFWNYVRFRWLPLRREPSPVPVS